MKTRIAPFASMIALAAIVLIAPSLPAQDQTPVIQPLLIQGEIDEAAKRLARHLDQHEGDQQARFQLGAVQFFQALEGFAQSMHHYGARSGRRRLGVINIPIPIPPNPNSKAIGYEDARKILQQFLTDLNTCRDTLAKVDDPQVKLPMPIGMVRLDLNGDGLADENEALWRMLNRANSRAGVTEQQARQFVIHFDLGDVYWMRAYTHLLAATAETTLAHDWREMFEVSGHLLFQKVKTPHAFLDRTTPAFQWGDVDVLDVIAMIHTMRLEVTEPKRLAAALAHMEKAVELSRISWQIIMTEADDDHEWIPNAQQTSVLAGIKLSPQMINDWLSVLDEWEAILQGKKLIPFWRTGEDRGVNLRKVFLAPRPFDLVLWIHGSGATPYLEKGPVTTPETWRKLTRTFGSNFFGFAFWFN